MMQDISRLNKNFRCNRKSYSIRYKWRKIKPCITIFDAQHPPKIYNNQLIRYAGYEDVGDPSELKITQLAEHLGWQGKHTDFDILPLIYKIPGESLKFYNYQPEMIKEVPITHDRFPKLEKLGLKWYAVPIISNMDLKLVESHIQPRRSTAGTW